MFQIANKVVIIAIIIFILLIVGIIAYYITYNKKINKIINGDDRTNKTRLTPAKFSIILVIVVVIMFSIFELIVINSNNSDGETYLVGKQENINCYQIYEDVQLPEYLQIYNIDANLGYNKNVKTQGELRYTYFVSKTRYDTFHPSIIIFIEYLGDAEIVGYEYMGGFRSINEEKNETGFGSTGGGFDKYIMIVCDKSDDKVFSIELALNNTYTKAEKLGDAAVVNETIEIY